MRILWNCVVLFKMIRMYQQCYATCSTCPSPDPGTSFSCYSPCPTGRTYNAYAPSGGVTGTCDCPTGSGNNASPPTDSTCSTCAMSYCTKCTTATSCDTCATGNNRGGSQCTCSAGYYDASVAVCATCHYSCTTCNGAGSSKCVTCDGTTNFRAISSTSCPCKNTYYDDGANALCASCHYSCTTCSAALKTNCLTCDATTNFRTFTTPQCLCNNKYYDDGADAICASCHYSCTTCSASLKTNCLTCDLTTNFRNTVTTTCICKDGYTDTGVSVCSACHYSCTTCTGTSSTSCTTCNAPINFRTTQTSTSCVCSPGYYDAGVAICSNTCHYSCATCSGPLSTNCLTCNAPVNFRISSSTSCVCSPGYYDVQVATCSNACHYSCTTCSGPSSTNCLTCNPPVNFRTQQSSTQCLCGPGYFDNGVAICVGCHYSCLTCNSPKSTGCTISCNDTQFRNTTTVTLTNTCPCITGYFDNNVPNCAPCDKSCFTCSSGSKTGCLSCDPVTHRNLLSSNNSCSCQQGYGENSNGSLICMKTCDVTCLTCTNSSINGCLTCNGAPPTYRNLSMNGMCVCNYGFQANTNGVCTHVDCSTNGYFDNNKQACGSCDYTCLTCIGPTNQNCSSCDPNNFRAKMNSQCSCAANYYEIQNQAMCASGCNGGYVSGNQCLNCHPLCSSCNGPSALNCTACAYDHYDELNTNQKGQQYYQKSPINVVMNVQSFICQNSKSSVVANNSQNNNVAITITSTNLITKEVNLQQSYDSLNIVLPQSIYKAGQNYSVLVQASKAPSGRLLQSSQKNSTFNTTFIVSIKSVDKKVTLLGGNRDIGDTGNLVIQCQIFDFDNQDSPDMVSQSYTFTWSCNPVIFNVPCVDKNGQPLDTSSTSQNFTISSSNFVPNTGYRFIVVVHDKTNNSTYNASAIYQVIEEYVPPLIIEFDKNILALPVNLNLKQNFIYDYSEPVDSDNLFYSANLVYDFSVVKTIVYHYSTVQFRIWDYFLDFTNKSGTTFYFIGQVYNPQYLTPSRFTIMMNVNIPPQMCQVSISPSQGVELTDLFRISISNCQTSSPTLTYRFVYYQSQMDYDSDNVQQSLAKASLLTPFIDQNSLDTYLPKSLDGPYIILVLSVQDSLFGVSNYTVNVTVTPLATVNETKLINNINNISDFSAQLRALQVISVSLNTLQTTFPNLTSLMTSLISNATLQKLRTVQQNQILQIQAYTSTRVNDTASLISSTKSNSKILVNKIYSELNYQKANPSCVLFQSTQDHLIILNAQIDSQQILGGIILQNLISQQNSLNQSLEKNSTQFQAINNQNQQVIKLMNQTRQLKIQQMIPNEPTKLLITKSATQAVALTTNKRLSELLGQNIVDNTQTEFLNTTQPKDTTDTFFAFSYLQYAGNPYSSDKTFPYADQGFSAIDLQITKQASGMASNSSLQNSQNIKPSKYVAFTFNNKKKSAHRLLVTNASNQNGTQKNASAPQVCVSAVLAKGSKGWSASECVTVTSMGKTSCQCTTISPTSVVADYNGLFASSNSKIFDASSLGAIAHFPWQKVSLFWMIVFVTIVFLVSIPLGYRRDISDKKLEDELKLKNEVIDVIDLTERPDKYLENIPTQQKLGTMHKSSMNEGDAANDQEERKELTKNIDKNDNNYNNVNNYNNDNNDQDRVVIQQSRVNFDFNSLAIKGDCCDHPRDSINLDKDFSAIKLIEVDIMATPDKMTKQFSTPIVPAEGKKDKKDDKKVVENVTFIRYFLISHSYLNIWHSYEPLKRPIRSCLLYLCLIQSLAVTMYFGSSLFVVRVIILAILSSIASAIIVNVLKALLQHKQKILNIIGVLIFIGLSAFLIFVILAIIATTSSIGLTNQWSIQYAIQIIHDATLGAIAPIAIKFKFFR